MNKNLFIIASPLQLINAIEYGYYDSLKDIDIIVISQGNQKTMNQIMNIVVFFELKISKVIDLPKNKFETMTFPRFIKRSTILENKYDIIVSGEFRSPHINHIINCLEHDKVILVDDGNSSLAFDKIVSSLNLKKILFDILKYKSNVKFNALFTLYDKSNFTNINVLRNNYKYLKEKVGSKPVLKEVYFIGQPLVELGIVSESFHYNYIKEIIKHFKPYKFNYVLHRRNNMEFIEGLSKQLGFTVINYETPLEIQFTLNNDIPYIVSTFYSTAIYTLKKLFNIENTIAFVIKNENISSSFKDKVALDNYYKNFKSEKISIIDLTTGNFNECV